MKEKRELIYNIKVLYFINQDNIYKHYKLIKEKFKDNKYGCNDFFTYFDKTWNSKGKKYNMKYYPN